MSGFWEKKEPCWMIQGCSKFVYNKCPAYLNQEIPCWETAYTECERLTGIHKDCKECKVTNLYKASHKSQ